MKGNFGPIILFLILMTIGGFLSRLHLKNRLEAAEKRIQKLEDIQKLKESHGKEGKSNEPTTSNVMPLP